MRKKTTLYNKLESFLFLLESLYLEMNKSDKSTNQELQQKMEQLFSCSKDFFIQVEQLAPDLSDWKYREIDSTTTDIDKISDYESRKLQNLIRSVFEMVGESDPLEELLKAKADSMVLKLLLSHYTIDQKMMIIKKIVLSDSENISIVFDYFKTLSYPQREALRTELKNDSEIRIAIFHQLVGPCHEEESMKHISALLKLGIFPQEPWNLNHQEHFASSIAFYSQRFRLGTFLYHQEQFLDEPSKEKRDFKILECLGYDYPRLKELLEDSAFSISVEKLEFLEPILYYGLENSTLTKNNIDRILSIFERRARTEDHEKMVALIESITLQLPRNPKQYHKVK